VYELRIDKFEGRIRTVSTKAGGDWYCEVYGTKRKERNGNWDIADNVVENAKEMSRVPQMHIVVAKHLLGIEAESKKE
jgi:hypothetical protein